MHEIATPLATLGARNDVQVSNLAPEPIRNYQHVDIPPDSPYTTTNCRQYSGLDITDSADDLSDSVN